MTWPTKDDGWGKRVFLNTNRIEGGVWYLHICWSQDPAVVTKRGNSREAQALKGTRNLIIMLKMSVETNDSAQKRYRLRSRTPPLTNFVEYPFWPKTLRVYPFLAIATNQLTIPY